MLCSLLLLSSCIVNFRKIKPSDVIVEKEYRQEAFDKIEINVTANAKFVQSAEGDYRVVLSAPENYHELFKMAVNEEEKLEVDFKKHNTNIETDDVKLTIYSPTLHELVNAGVGRFVIDSLNTPVLMVENAGVGALTMKGLHLSMADIRCSGVGNMDLSGETVRAKMECSGVGNINAANLKARALKAEVSGVGGIQCYATDSLKAEVSGVGSLKYAGEPHFKKLNSSGIGKVSPL